MSEYLISLKQFIKFVGVEDPRQRKCVEGENVYNANHLMLTAITKRTERKIEILSLCLQSSDLFGLPHEINIKLEYSEDKKKKKNIYSKCS